MNITDAQLLAIAIDMADIDRIDDGLPRLSHAEVREFKTAFAENIEDRDRTRSMIAPLAASIINHLGLREPRDERVVTISGVNGPPFVTPMWVFDQAAEIEQYMATHASGHWVIGGIQKRTV